MSKRSFSFLCLTLLMASPSLMSCGGGGGGSPTEPPAPQILSVAGSWSGIWVPPVTVSMALTQSGNSATGTLSSLGITLQVRGTTTFQGPGQGTFNWEVFNGGCGTWTGSMQVSSGQMSGQSVLSTAGCVNPDRIAGLMLLTRDGGAAGLEASSAPQGTLAELVEALGSR